MSILNPVALVLIAFTTVISLLVGHWEVGLAVGDEHLPPQSPSG